MMKRLVMTLLANMVLAVALVSGVVLENHHHDANGALCVSSCGAQATCSHGDDCGTEGGDPADCSLHLDTFCCDGSHHHHGADCLSGSDMPVALMPWQVAVPQEDYVTVSAAMWLDAPPVAMSVPRQAITRRGPPAV